MKNGSLILVLMMLMTMLLSACQPIQTEAEPHPAPAASEAGSAALPASTGMMVEPTGFTRTVHDPVMTKEGDTWYVYFTGPRIPFLCSKDMLDWTFCGRVMDAYPAWTEEVNAELGAAWAPDISFFNGKWHLYWAASTFGSQESAIGLLTNATLDPASPDYKWVDEGVVLRSHVGDEWNAIDPNLVIDAEGEPWLAWGSYWNGLYMRKIDAATGKFSDSDKTWHHLADRSMVPDSNGAIEGAFLVHRGDWWYLFASFDQCCQGEESTYNVRVGRSKDLTGPYLDRDGNSMLKGGGTLILDAYDVWRGPGHNGMWVEDGVYWMPYHAYNAQLAGMSYLRLESLGWTEDGWPVLASQENK